VETLDEGVGKSSLRPGMEDVAGPRGGNGREQTQSDRPPTCWKVFTSPEAIPESVLATPATPALITAGKESPAPSETSTVLPGGIDPLGWSVHRVSVLSLSMKSVDVVMTPDVAAMSSSSRPQVRAR
jgi:hypothetical protein